MALNILSIGTPGAVCAAIAGGDTKYIQQAAGVGKRVAERVVVELKDKVGLSGVDLSTTDILFAAGSRAGSDEAVQALVALGYSEQDAVTALASIDTSLSLEQRVTLALKDVRRT
jgi:Holliday junction DNA helicase RuvA